jgi:large subunit ribosomal protein L2
MPLVKVKPTSPGRRGLVKVVTPGLHKGEPHWPLVTTEPKGVGRNNAGRITMRHKGGGHKQHYRVIDFRRDKDGVVAKVERIEYDPNRSAHLALLLYADGERRYILAPKGRRGRRAAAFGSEAPIKAGNTLPLRNVPVGTTVHCIEMLPGKGAQLARAAGTGAQLLAREGSYAQLRLRSGEIRKVHVDCRATIGEAGNDEHNLESIGKAGPQALARHPADRAWRGDEPDRPSARRRRRPHRGGAAPGFAVGRAEQGLQDATQQAHAGHDRARPAPRRMKG